MRTTRAATTHGWTSLRRLEKLMANREHGGVRRVGVVLLVVFFAVTTAARAADEARSLQRVYALTVKDMKTPRLRWSCQTTSIPVGGKYPQVFHNGVPLLRVNAALRSAALADERSLISGGCPAGGPNGSPAPAIYELYPSLRWTSASSVVVSALMQAGSVPPGANFSYDWAAVTIRVATGRQVGMTALFAHPDKGLAAVAAAARASLSARNSCVKRYSNPSGFAPRKVNYRYFSLTTRGLAIGFTAGAVAPRS